MADIKLDYISVGGNRNPAAADWDRDSELVAFGADNNIALWHPLSGDQRGITALLKGHDDEINAVRWMKPACLDEHVLISGSVDKTVRIWRQSASGNATWFIAAMLHGHEASINCIATLSPQDIFVTGAADATFRIWQFQKDASKDHGFDIVLKQRSAINPKFIPLAMDIAMLHTPKGENHNEMALAIAGTKASIQIYATTGSEDGSNIFSFVASLTGHEAWIRSLAITYEDKNTVSSDLIIASASQDKYIRLWRIHRGQDLPSSSHILQGPNLGILKSSLSNKAHQFTTAAQQFSITFEALLLGHEDWIYTASWHRFNGRLQLLSASADNSLAVWEADDTTGIWTCIARLGETSVQKGSTTATGSTGGFWLGLWSADATAVISLGRTGGWRLWQRESASQSDRWIQKSAITGHTREVKGIAWSRDGSYLLSTGNDQTTRLHAELKNNGIPSWHEFSRPQIHGYDLNCIDTISNTQFISGADEKLLRVFDEPDGVADILSNLCGIAKPADAQLPDAANIPVLGLSNKAVAAAADKVPQTNGDDIENAVSPLILKEPPTEDHLSRHLLWPEREKLYGHGYEINAVAASHDGTMVATACRASSVDHAVIRLYDTKEWREVKPPLKAHTLTVTGLRFSESDKFLLSIGRDRMFCLWKRDSESEPQYVLVHSEEKAHSRMILAADWAPEAAGGVFATGGRDKNIKIWRTDEAGDAICATTIQTDAPVTALAILPTLIHGGIILAYGLETGDVAICNLDGSNDSHITYSTWEKNHLLQQSKAISQLLWRSKRVEDGLRNVWQLAIACADSSLQIASVNFGPDEKSE